MRLNMRTGLDFVLLPTLVLLCFNVVLPAHAVALRPSVRKTTPGDLIGKYELDISFSKLLAQESCAKTMSFQTFRFDQSPAPISFPAPRRFNILIPHDITRVDNKKCESSGRILAVESSHPYALNMTAAVVDTWARGGAKSPAALSKLAPATVTEAMGKLPFVFGYDWDMRSCTGATVLPGTAYMFFQPSWDVVVSTSPRAVLQGRYNYLLLTRERSTEGCVYRRAAEDPANPRDKGPVNDPSLSKRTASPTPAASDPPRFTSVGRGREPGDVSTAAENAKESTPDADLPTASDLPAVGPEQEPETPKAFSPEANNRLPPVESPASCFPADSHIALSDGASVRMADLQVGAAVRVRAGLHSEVFTFSHRDHTVLDADFVRIVTADDSATVTLSPGHYIYANGALVAAHAVKVGDNLELADGTSSRVISVESVRASGLFAPHSLHGDLIVDGVRVSSYTKALHPTIAHRMLAPLRWAYRAGIPSATILERTAPYMARFVPSGPTKMATAK